MTGGAGPGEISVLVRGLVADYGSGPVLRDVDLDVAPGEIVALLGPSGCGKTTLLRCIAGLEAPVSGSVTIGGERVGTTNGQRSLRRRVGMVFQDGALFPHLSVLANVGYGLDRSERKSGRAEQLLRMVGLDDKAARPPSSLSGGEQQRVALARALAPNPAVLLLDEPFSSLDAALRVQLRTEVHDLLREIGVTVIFVTHDQHEALAMGDRVGVMRDGQLEQVADPVELYAAPATPWVAGFVGEANLLAAETSDRVASTEIGDVTLSTAIDGPATVLCRPEQFVVARGGDATVATATYLGRDTRYEIRLAGGVVVAVRAYGMPLHHPGESVSVRFAGAAAHAWPADELVTSS